MPVAPNAAAVLSVETSVLDPPAGQPIEVTVEAEAGVALFAAPFSRYWLRMTITDTTEPVLLDTVEPQVRLVSGGISRVTGRTILMTP